MNLRWSWDERPATSSAGSTPTPGTPPRHDPVRLLGTVSRERLEALAADPASSASSARSHDELQPLPRRAPLVPGPQRRRRRCARSPTSPPSSASPRRCPQYSGGLGVLAGDHLKAASDLGVPLVGIGLFYRHGYFRQALNADGWQQERYPDLDPYAMALRRCDGVRVDRRPGRHSRSHAPGLAGRRRAASRSTCSTPTSRRTPDDVRQVTDRLYGGDTEHRLRQEILLGIGGVRALDAARRSTPRCSTPTRATPASSASSASAGCIVDDGLSLRRGGRGGAGRAHLHHPHAGAGRHRPLPARAHGAVLHRLGRASAASSLDELMALGHRPGRGARRARSTWR